MTNFFRKEAIDNFSSTNDINKGLRAVEIKRLAIVLSLVVCTVIFVIWLIFGTIYETLSVSGIIWPSNDSGGVYSLADGILTKVTVRAGTAVEAGDILAVIPQEEILKKIEAAKKSGISDAELDDLYNEYDRLSVLRAGIDGIVTYIAEENSYICLGEKAAEIALYDEASNNKKLTAFIPAEIGELVKSGMQAQVMPVFAPREKYGYIDAYISEVSPYPVSGKEIKEKNALFASLVDSGTNYLQLEISLRYDENAKSRLKWSNPQSGAIDIMMGTICKTNLIVEKCSPIEWLF